MDLLPSIEERKWLGRYLRKLIERKGTETFLCSPLLEPTSKYFPETWSGRVADVHKLTQRLMHQAGLGDLRLMLQGFAGGRKSWDTGTAAWFAGITGNVCEMGVHVAQLANPESAVGVMAHEVAHAWRAHHHLQADDRDREELLTDLTTIYLGFGILTTNNTDRYRASGNWKETRWSVNSGGYLPPQAMSWVLALQASARNRKDELRAIEKCLEPNQRACFRAAIDEIRRAPSWVEDLSLPGDVSSNAHVYRLLVVEEPQGEEALELPAVPGPDPNRNTGKSIFRVPQPRNFALAIFAMFAGLFIGIGVGVLLFGEGSTEAVGASMLACAFLGFVVGPYLSRRKFFCSERDCHAEIASNATLCPACGGTFVRTLKNQREFEKIRLDQLDRDSASIEYEECEECRPEVPCTKHAATMTMQDFLKPN